MKYALFYREGEPLPAQAVAQIREKFGAGVVGETPTRLVVEGEAGVVDDFNDKLPGWLAVRVVGAHIPETIWPKIRALL